MRLLSLLRDEELISTARQEAQHLVLEDPELAAHPGLAAMVAELVTEDRAEFLDRASAARLWFDDEYEPVVIWWRPSPDG